MNMFLPCMGMCRGESWAVISCRLSGGIAFVTTSSLKGGLGAWCVESQ